MSHDHQPSCHWPSICSLVTDQSCIMASFFVHLLRNSIDRCMYVIFSSTACPCKSCVMCVFACTCVCVFACTCVCVFACTCVCICLYMCVCICKYMCVCVFACTCVCVCVFACMVHVCICIWVWVRVHFLPAAQSSKSRTHGITNTHISGQLPNTFTTVHPSCIP